MGALTGNAVQSTYLDLVQLGKSGAGLPSHAGKEAAVYDGSGEQILGRTAVRHWLDPDPSAIAGTWEFSTYGNATQAALETAGWTFSNCTGTVANGMLKLVSTGSDNARATIVVSLNGDFDYVTKFMSVATTNRTNFDSTVNMKIGIPGDVGHLVSMLCLNQIQAGQTVSTTYDAVPTAGTNIASAGQAFYSDVVVRICRFSGTVSCVLGGLFGSSALGISGTSASQQGWAGGSAAEASAYTRLCIAFDAVTAGHSIYVPFIRRFA